MKKVFLIRHGNAYDKDWKQVAESVLNETGQKHAESLAERFKDLRVDNVYCSTMDRAKVTCEIFLKHHPEVKPIFTDDLKEVVDEVFASDHEKLVFLKDRYEVIREKAFETFLKIVNESDGENVFLFTHGHWIRFVILSILYGSVDGFFSMNVDFASVSVIQVAEGARMKLLLFNDCRHTEGLPFGCELC